MDPVLLTLVERKTCFEMIFKIDQQSQDAVDQGMDQQYKRLGDQSSHLFKMITSDNGSEFAGIYERLSGIRDVYFVHPYAPYERGTKENQHKLIRRFIPKGKRIADTANQTIKRIQQWVNHYPRKILDYQTAERAFFT